MNTLIGYGLTITDGPVSSNGGRPDTCCSNSRRIEPIRIATNDASDGHANFLVTESPFCQTRVHVVGGPR